MCPSLSSGPILRLTYDPQHTQSNFVFCLDDSAQHWSHCIIPIMFYVVVHRVVHCGAPMHTTHPGPNVEGSLVFIDRNTLCVPRGGLAESFQPDDRSSRENPSPIEYNSWSPCSCPASAAPKKGGGRVAGRDYAGRVYIFQGVKFN